MNSGGDQPTDGQEADRSYIVSGAEMDRIVLPLTVVHGYVQLLRRRVARDSTNGSDDLHQALVHMEEATRSISAELWAIMAATTPVREDAD